MLIKATFWLLADAFMYKSKIRQSLFYLLKNKQNSKKKMFSNEKPTKWQNLLIYNNMQSYESEREFAILKCVSI